MNSAGFLAALGLGFAYFIAAIPAGAAAGAAVPLACLGAWLGYSAGGLLVVLAGAPLRAWLVAKLRIPVERNPDKLVWRVWDRAGLWGLGLLAPVTIGPQAGAVLALAVGERPARIVLALSLGVLPWCALFGALAFWGIRVVR